VWTQEFIGWPVKSGRLKFSCFHHKVFSLFGGLLFQSISSSIKVSEVRNECKKIPPIPKLENGTPFIFFFKIRIFI